MIFSRFFAFTLCHQKSSTLFVGYFLHRRWKFSTSDEIRHQRFERKDDFKLKEAYVGMKETFVTTARFHVPLVINAAREQSHVFDLNVVYMDTANPNSKGTVLLVHGVPGNFRSFEGIARPFIERGYRVVIPHFPGCSGTNFIDARDERLFDHTMENKSDFLGAFIDKLNLHRDLVLIAAHSAGSYPVMHYVSTSTKLNSAAKHKALAFLNPTVHRPFKVLPNPFLLTFLVTCWKQPLLQSIAKVLLRRLAIYRKVDYDNLDLLAIAGLTAWNLDFPQINQCLNALRGSDWNIFAAISEDDKFIESHISHDFLRALGVESHQVLKYDRNMQLEATGSHRPGVPSKRRAVVFNTGCHFSHQRYPSLLAAELLQLLPTK